MKYKDTYNLKKLLLLFMGLLFLPLNAQKKFVIVLDAGHGGSDFGAVRKYDDLGNLAEKHITLEVALQVGRMLEKNKDFKVIYTRKYDEYPSLTERTNLANRSKADIFVSIHVNANTKTSPYGTETFVQGPDQNRTNLEVAKAENSVIYLDAQDRETFASYDPNSPESLIALKIQQSKYLESSLIFGGLVEENFEKKNFRNSRGVKQQNLHVLRMNAMPSVLIELGFLSNYDEAKYLISEKGQSEMAKSIYDALIEYRRVVTRNSRASAIEEKPREEPLKNDFRILLMSTPNRYNAGDPELKGLSYLLPIKENGLYKYYYATTNFASVRDSNVKTARDAGFKNAVPVAFIPDQRISKGYYTIEVAVSKQKLPSNSFVLKTLKDVERKKEKGSFYYTYGKVYSLEDAVKLQKELEAKGIRNTIIEKVIN